MCRITYKKLKVYYFAFKYNIEIKVKFMVNNRVFIQFFDEETKTITKYS
jgi:hypothetical protein